MTDESSDKPGQQREGAPPIIENPKRPPMDNKPARPRRINGKVVLMDSATPPDTSGKPTMSPVPANAGASMEAPPDRPDQEGTTTSAAKDEGYVRLRMRVENGQMSVLSAHAVAGPLIMPDAIHSGYVYEVMLRQRRVGVDTIPDLGESRSFPDPEGRPGMEGHHIEIETSYEFNVRIPRSQLSLRTLPQTQIALYRVKEHGFNMQIGPGVLGDQFSRELREIARLKGIRIEDLPSETQAQLRQALR